MPQNLPPIYVAAAKTYLPNQAEVQTALARADTQSRQVPIKPTPGNELFTSPEVPLTTANRISSAIGTFRTHKDPNIVIKAAQLLCNSSILLELQTIEAAQWLKRSGTKDQLLQKLGILLRFLFSSLLSHPHRSSLDSQGLLHTLSSLSHPRPHLLPVLLSPISSYLALYTNAFPPCSLSYTSSDTPEHQTP